MTDTINIKEAIENMNKEKCSISKITHAPNLDWKEKDIVKLDNIKFYMRVGK